MSVEGAAVTAEVVTMASGEETLARLDDEKTVVGELSL